MKKSTYKKTLFVGSMLELIWWSLIVASAAIVFLVYSEQRFYLAAGYISNTVLLGLMFASMVFVMAVSDDSEDNEVNGLGRQLFLIAVSFGSNLVLFLAYTIALDSYIEMTVLLNVFNLIVVKRLLARSEKTVERRMLPII
jgi:predicted ferric reductase